MFTMSKKSTPQETPIVHGWRVESLVIDRFLACVVDDTVSWQEAATWIRENAHKAESTPQRSPDGRPVYRLAHPWTGPDIALVVATHPSGIRTALTCGWWEEDTSKGPAVMPSVGQLPPKRPELRKADEPFDLPPSLSCLPGDVSLDAVRPGLTLDPHALTREESKAWQKWLGALALSCSVANEQARSLKIANIRRLLRKIEHEKYEQKFPSFKTAVPVPREDRQTYNKHLLDSLGEVLREVLGQEEAHRLFNLAKERAWKRGQDATKEAEKSR